MPEPNQQNMERAANLVDTYKRVHNSIEFARLLPTIDRSAAYSEQETDFLWEVLDAAFDAGASEADTGGESR